MNIFEELAATVQTEWQKKGQRLEAFPEVATRCLETFKYDSSKEQLDHTLAEWFLARQAKDLPEQINVHNTFGQPPITVFNNGKFVVDIYIWLNFDTSIHSHGFRGAFRVLHGSSLHEEFTVKTLGEIATDVALTDLGMPDMEVLTVGDVRTILPCKELTHRVIHLENPTVTLCVKSINESEISQWHFFANGLAIKKRHLPPGLIKEIYYFQYLILQDSDLAMPFLARLLDQQDISTQMNLCEDISAGTYDISEVTTQIILDEVLARHSQDEWFQRYEAVNALLAEELHFETCDSPILRLTAHFINQGLTLSAAQPYLSELAGRDLSKKEITGFVAGLVDVDAIFQLELSGSDLSSLKSLIENPMEKIPARLQVVPQLAKMRVFVQS
jgi:hypothetical protein